MFVTFLFLLLLVEMGRKKLFWIGRALGFLLLIPGILGWGKEGHYAVCKIAEVSISVINSKRLFNFFFLNVS
jgi:hypothetical protein